MTIDLELANERGYLLVNPGPPSIYDTPPDRTPPEAYTLPGVVRGDPTPETAGLEMRAAAVEAYWDTLAGPAPPAQPAITRVVPNTGGPDTPVTLIGTGLTGTTAVRFGADAATGVVAQNDTTVTCHAPAVAGAGAVDVTAVTPGGDVVLTGGFTWA